MVSQKEFKTRWFLFEIYLYDNPEFIGSYILIDDNFKEMADLYFGDVDLDEYNEDYDVITNINVIKDVINKRYVNIMGLVII